MVSGAQCSEVGVVVGAAGGVVEDMVDVRGWLETLAVGVGSDPLAAATVALHDAGDYLG